MTLPSRYQLDDVVAWQQRPATVVGVCFTAGKVSYRLALHDADSPSALRRAADVVLALVGRRRRPACEADSCDVEPGAPGEAAG